MKYLIALVIVVVAASSLVLLQNKPSDNNTAVTGLPWQIDIRSDGSTQVFGITPGQTTLAETIEQHGDDLKLAIIAAPQESGTLEAYYSHYSAGPITGKLLLVLDVAPQQLASLRLRAFQEGGMRRYRLHPDDLPVAYQAPVSVINFLPSIDLDDEIAQSRFGTPAEIVQVTRQQRHWLYPDKGLEVILDAAGKDVLQYLQPRAFGAHRDQLLQSVAATENPHP